MKFARLTAFALAAGVALAIGGIPQPAEAGSRGFSLHVPGFSLHVGPRYRHRGYYYKRHKRHRYYRGRHHGKRHHYKYKRRHHRNHRAEKERKSFCHVQAKACGRQTSGVYEKRQCMHHRGC